MEGDTAVPAEVSEKEFRKMERDIDDFLSSIRKDVTQSTDPPGEATGSGVFNECDSISSGDFEHQSELVSHASNNEQSSLSHAASSSKNKQKEGQKKGKNDRGNKQKKIGSSRSTAWRGRGASSSRKDHDQHRMASSSKRDHHTKKSSLSEEADYQGSLSPRVREESHQGKSLSSRGKAHHERSFARKRDACEELSLSAEEGEAYRGDRFNSRRQDMNTRGKTMYFKRRLAEAVDDNAENCYNSNQNFSLNRMSRSRSRETESMYHRIYAVESDSAASDDYDGDQNRHPYWGHGENDPLMEDEDDQSSLAGSFHKSSIITACLKQVIAVNPEIAKKITEACMSFSNKSVDRTFDSDYEYEEGSQGSFEDQSGRVSARSWRGSRSPSYLESLDSSAGPSGARDHRTRQMVTERRRRDTLLVMIGRDPRQMVTERRRDTLLVMIGRDPHHQKIGFINLCRSSGKHHRHYHEEDPRKLVSRSIRNIRKQCEEETDPIVHHALLVLLDVHERECDMYLKKPDAHPDYNKEYRIFLDTRTRCIINLGGDPNGYDFQSDWKRYWPAQITRVFREGWETNMHKCTQMLQKRGHVSISLQALAKKDIENQPSEKKHKMSQHGSENVDTKESEKNDKEVKETEEQKEPEADSTVQCKTKEEMDAEILSILKLLSYIKHKFKDCEASFDIFYQKVLSLKQKNSDLYDFFQGNLPLLKAIDENLKETLEDGNLTLIQKVIIQETHERFKGFLNKSEETNPHSMKAKEKTADPAVEVTEANNQLKIGQKNLSTAGKIPETPASSATITDQIPCVITASHSSVVVSQCYGKEMQICHPIRTLTEISLLGTSSAAGEAASKPADSLPASQQQGDNQSTCKTDATSEARDPVMIQPTPPGVTPPPPGETPTAPGVTSPAPGVTSPPPGVTSPAPIVNSPPIGVTSPPPGITSLPPVVTSPPPGVTSLPIGVAPPPSGVTPPPLGVTPPIPGDTSTPPGVSPPSGGLPSPPLSVTSPTTASVPPLTQGVASPSLSVTQPSSVTPPSHSFTSHSNIRSLPHSTTPPPASSTSSPVNVTAPPPSIAPHSSVPPLSQASSGSQSSLLDVSQQSQIKCVSNVPRSRDTKSKAIQHSSTLPEQSNKSRNEKNIITVSLTQRVVPERSKEFLRSTIRDCFQSTTCPSEERSINTSITDKKDEASYVTSMPCLSEDILKMFVVKPEDINESANKSSDLTSSGNPADNDVKQPKKAPIKITIPQFAKQRRMPAFKSPMNDDRELS
ncbi:hypothetical protein GWK47_003434 [Chionoecetes opilio]|uniref:Uncharacterized protein n=1 Tax=Chionoecetes opilio TaxID=41210 RepID=A0A8J4YL35_CHIOP|nr:hypothetical protein GWK47_003434 [Chionoecetes opilio]